MCKNPHFNASIAFKEIIKFNLGHMQEALIQSYGVPIRRRNLDPQKDTKVACAQRKGHVRTQTEGSHLKAKESLSKKINMTILWFWTSAFKNCEKIRFLLFNPPSLWYFVWQP